MNKSQLPELHTTALATLARFGPMALLSLGPAAATAFARFAYALVLPDMRAALDLSYAEAGLLNTANALGYLLGAVVVLLVGSRAGDRRLFSVGMVATALVLVAAGLTDDFTAQVVLRAAAGLTGAAVFISGAVLASNAFPQDAKASSIATGVYFAGAGIGIVISAAGIPWLLAEAGHGAWRMVWIAVGTLSLVFAALADRAVRGMNDTPQAAHAASWRVEGLGPTLGSYLLFGAGYIGYMTFVVAWMVAHGAGPLHVTITWGALGIATLVSPLLWRPMRTRLAPEQVLVLAGLVISAGAAVPLGSTSLAAMTLSAVLFGAAMFTVPTVVTDLARTALPRTRWASALAVFTVVFAVGQAVGPVLTGWLSDATHSLHGGLAASVVLLLAGSGVAALQPAVRTQPGTEPQAARPLHHPRTMRLLRGQ